MDRKYEADDLVNARRFKRTGFDCDPHVLGPGSEPKVIETCFGTWIINGNGAASDKQSGLTWIQAPWGMKWSGRDFHGKPVSLSWYDASRLFGQGVFVFGDKQLAKLSDEDIKASEIDNGYTRGICTVTFAGSSLWRLPTFAEWRTIQFFNTKVFDLEDTPVETKKRDIHSIFPTVDFWNDRFWTATGKWAAGSVLKLLAKVIDPDGSTCLAWKMMFDRYIDDDAKWKHQVLFVRNT